MSGEESTDTTCRAASHLSRQQSTHTRCMQRLDTVSEPRAMHITVTVSEPRPIHITTAAIAIASALCVCVCVCVNMCVCACVRACVRMYIHVCRRQREGKYCKYTCTCECGLDGAGACLEEAPLSRSAGCQARQAHTDLTARCPEMLPAASPLPRVPPASMYAQIYGINTA